ncbi:MAG: DMT family transporter [Bacteroidota bacterium]
MSYRQSLILLHIVILIWGFTGILGKVLTDVLLSEQLVWHRMLIGFLSIGAAVLVMKKTPWPSTGTVLQLFAVGVVIALHWVTFFGSIKASNVSIALACLSSGSLFTAILEPIFFKRKILAYELILGLAVIGALVLIFKFETNYQLGIILSVTSAFLASLFTTLNGKFVRNTDPVKVSLFEIFGGWVAVSIYLVFSGQLTEEMFDLPGSAWWRIIVLGTICTGFAFLAGVAVMKKLSPFTVSLSINLEPIYSIILAFYFFSEHRVLTTEFYIGAIIILGTVVANALLKARRNKQTGELNESIS